MRADFSDGSLPTPKEKQLGGRPMREVRDHGPHMVGRALGRYQVIAKLGEGGMGEVYRARDSRLGRDVALKLLPADVATDPERLARFEHEARTVAGLNHPNIVTLYSVEDIVARAPDASHPAGSTAPSD